MYRQRIIKKNLQQALETFPCVLITGARQVGKTTFVKKELSKDYKYVLLDDIELRLFAEEDPNGFLDKYSPPVILDEIQNTPFLFPHIKSRIEEDRTAGNWVLTGSQVFAMMKNVSETLAGRIAILNLYPFSICEAKNEPYLFAGFPDYIEFLFNPQLTLDVSDLDVGQFIIDGLYPELKTNSRISRSMWYSSYVQAYLERDVRGNIREANITDFGRFLKLLAVQTGNQLNYSHLSNALGITVPTVKNWVSILEASYVIHLVQPYFKNFGKRIIKAPKIYFMDTGLVAHMVGLKSSEHLISGPMAGSLFETLIVSNFIKVISSLDMNLSIYYWRSIGGLEVDLLIDYNGQLIPVEIKLSSTVTPNYYRNLLKWRDVSGYSGDSLIISQSKNLGRIGPNIFNCHWSIL